MENNDLNKVDLEGSEDVSTNTEVTNEMNQSSTNSQQPFETKKPEGNPEKSSVGAVVGSIIVILIIIIGGLYFWGKEIVKEENLLNTTPEDIQNQEDEVLDSLENLNESDEIEDIEADLNSTELDDLEKELENIDLELEL